MLQIELKLRFSFERNRSGQINGPIEFGLGCYLVLHDMEHGRRAVGDGKAFWSFQQNFVLNLKHQVVHTASHHHQSGNSARDLIRYGDEYLDHQPQYLDC